MRSGANRSPFIPNGIMRLGKDIVNQREGNETACAIHLLGGDPNWNGGSTAW